MQVAVLANDSTINANGQELGRPHWSRYWYLLATKYNQPYEEFTNARPRFAELPFWFWSKNWCHCSYDWPMSSHGWLKWPDDFERSTKVLINGEVLHYCKKRFKNNRRQKRSLFRSAVARASNCVYKNRLLLTILSNWRWKWFNLVGIMAMRPSSWGLSTELLMKPKKGRHKDRLWLQVTTKRLHKQSHVILNFKRRRYCFNRSKNRRVNRKN